MNEYTEQIVDKIFEYYLKNHKKIILRKNNLKYYDLHYLVHIIIFYINSNKNEESSINLYNKIKSRHIQIFFSRIVDVILLDKNNNINYYLTWINLKEDQLLKYSLMYINE